MKIESLYDLFRFLTHYSFHLLIPLIFSILFFKENWKKAYLIMALTILIDLDHILAFPDVFVDGRFSIGFHFFHSYYAIFIYFILFFIKKYRILAIGLLFHIFTDLLDYLLYLVKADFLRNII